MTDPFSLTVGIVSLFQAGKQCFDFFSSVKNAPKDAEETSFEIEQVQRHYRAWGWYWKVDQANGKLSSNALENYVRGNPYKGEGIEKTLIKMVELLSNDKLLSQHYGIILKRRDMATRVRDYLSNLPFPYFKRFSGCLLDFRTFARYDSHGWSVLTGR
jgi:hypothetical protein